MSKFLRRRGPDSFGQRQLNFPFCNGDEQEFWKSMANGTCCLLLAAAVLHLRGAKITVQPVEDDFGNILVWNGEILNGLEVLQICSNRVIIF